MSKVPGSIRGEVPDLQFFEDFVSQNTVNARTIKCFPPGIELERFAAVCNLKGAPLSVQQFTASFVSDISNGNSSVAQKHVAIEGVLKVVHESTKYFETLEHYVWLVRLTVAAELLLNIPQRTDAARKRLCKALESMRLDAFNHSPVCVHHVAKALVEDIPLDTGLNLLHAIKKLAIYDSQLLYYVAVALLFAGLDVTLKPKTARHDSYGVRDVNELLSYLNEFNLLNLQERHDNLQTIYNTLKLFSLYENMILLREYNEQDKELEREHKTYADCFRVTLKQRNTFRSWLDRSRSMVNVFGNDRFDVNYLLLSDVIENEMRPLFDDFCVPEEL